MASSVTTRNARFGQSAHLTLGFSQTTGTHSLAQAGLYPVRPVFDSHRMDRRPRGRERAIERAPPCPRWGSRSVPRPRLQVAAALARRQSPRYAAPAKHKPAAPRSRLVAARTRPPDRQYGPLRPAGERRTGDYDPIQPCSTSTYIYLPAFNASIAASSRSITSEASRWRRIRASRAVVATSSPSSKNATATGPSLV